MLDEGLTKYRMVSC